VTDINAQRWARIEEIYEAVLELPSGERRPYVTTACAGDAALAGEILSMLAVEESGTSLEIERLVRDEGVADPLLGTSIGPWRIVDALGRGGAGAVYRVERCDGQYEQQAALKLLAPGLLSTDAAVRLAAERRILARLVHPHIARLIDGGMTTSGTPYLVMEYVDGQPLTAYCEDRRLSIPERLRLFQVVCAAVHHAHRALVVHRDLKPSNIYVSRGGEVKLLDFGIAKLLQADPFGETPVTRTGLRPLTLAYAAPEQVRGEPVTTAADVYALGVVLYELLAGLRPHAVAGVTAAEAERMILEQEPAPPSAVAAGADRLATRSEPLQGRFRARQLRGDLDRICLMALRKEPERRYASVEQFSADIDRYLSGHPVIAQSDRVAYRMRRFVRRNRVPLAVTALFAVVLTAFAATSLVQARQVAAERDRATLERDKTQRVLRIVIDLFRGANPDVVPDGDKQTIGQFLESAEPRVLAGLADDSEVSAAVKHALALVHRARSDFARARPLLEEALAESRAQFGPDDQETLTVQVSLGATLATMGHRADAIALLEDALERCERALGVHPLTMRALVMLGGAGLEPEQARPYLERGLAMGRVVLQPGDPEIARALNQLAVFDMDENRLADARARLEEALRAAERVNGGRNVVALTVLNNTGALLARTGDFAGAEAAHRRSAELAASLLGPETMQAAGAHNNLATVLVNQGKLQPALEHYTIAHDRYLKLVGATHVRTANAARNIALVLFILDRPREALPWMEGASRTIASLYGRDAREAVYYRAQLAVIHSALGRHAEAIPALRSAVARLIALAPAGGHSAVADTQVYLGHALLNAGRGAEAEAPYRAALDFRTRVLSVDHPHVAIVQCELGRALGESGRGAEALPLLDACVPKIRASGLFHDACRQTIIRLHERLRSSVTRFPSPVTRYP
jgi:serine/threonine-protein kinase